jgi:hypothetical protein
MWDIQFYFLFEEKVTKRTFRNHKWWQRKANGILGDSISNDERRFDGIAKRSWVRAN